MRPVRQRSEGRPDSAAADPGGPPTGARYSTSTRVPTLVRS